MCLDSCLSLRNPVNVRTITYGTEVGSLSIAECDEVSQLTGSQVRQCLPDLKWSGSQPSCSIGIIF